LVAQGKIVVLPATRAQGFESGFKCMRSLYIVGGSPSSSQLAFWRKYNLTLPKKILNALTHAFIKSFDSELEAMRSFAHTFSDDEAVILVDTYDFRNGVKNFITVAKELKENGGKIAMMYIDSGNLVQRSKYARKELDKNGLHDVRILLSGNIEEKMIEKMLKAGAMCDGFLVITELISSPDAPKLEVVYKLAEIQKGQDVRPVMKLSKSKKSYPAKKQVYRIRDEKGIMAEDIIGLENENIGGQPLLEKFIDNGKLVNYLPPLEEIRGYCKKEIDGLPPYLKILGKSKNYPVRYSDALLKLSTETEKKMH
jgi:nicotinate phosphoribosyltransferase